MITSTPWIRVGFHPLFMPSSCSTHSIMLFFFFFQAEDGIRDYKVTGVQTCALPILEVELDRRHLPRTTDGVARLHRDLRPVERTAPFVHDEIEVHRPRRLSQRLCRDRKSVV